MKIPGNARLNELIAGGDTPGDEGEVAFLNAYTRASDGESLIVICLDLKNQFDYYKEYEYAMFIMGYAIGQKDLLDRVDGLDLSNVNKDDDESLH